MALSCVRCRSPLEAGARFCGACGASAPERTATTAVEGACSGCGALAPKGLSVCEVCQSSLDGGRVALPGLGQDPYWVGVMASFQCRACGHVSPLNHLDVDGSVMCLRCGVDQRFDPEQWWKSVDFAHAVGDLAGSPEGRFPQSVSVALDNEVANVGVERTFAEQQQGDDDEGHAMTLCAMLGHPLCEGCRTPLALTELTEASLVTRCPSCQKSHSYDRPPSVARRYPALRGVVAEEHERANLPVDVQNDAGGAVLLRCPNCSAPLAVTGSSTVVTCRFCNAVSRLPPAALRGLGHHAPKRLLWWMLFQGPSHARARLRALAEERAARELAAARAPALAPRALQQRAPRDKRPSPALALAITGAIVVAVVVPALLFLPKKQSNAGAARAVTATEPTPAATAVAPKPLVALIFRGKVQKAQGLALKPGSPCRFDVETDGHAIRTAKLSCGDQVLYDDSRPMNGVSNRSWGFAEGRTDAGWVYFTKYSDIGQRSGRPQLQLDSGPRLGKVENTELPEWVVTLALDPHSEPRSGEPILAPTTPVVWEPLGLELTVKEATGAAPARSGARCRLEARPFVVSAGQTSCRAKLACGAKVVYDSMRPGFALPCTLGADGKLARLHDQKTSTGDKDPALDADFATGRVEVKDDGARAFELVLAR
ncbi:MAG: hypothetical protein AMXMBFR56_36270 [Polyangiaceae bacterium]